MGLYERRMLNLAAFCVVILVFLLFTHSCDVLGQERGEEEDDDTRRLFQVLVSHCLQSVLHPVSYTGPYESREERGAFYPINPPLPVLTANMVSCLLDQQREASKKEVEVDKKGVPKP